MRHEKRGKARTEDSSEILVAGIDMFGVAFKERTQLINRSEEGLSLRLLRPITKGGMLEISFSPDRPESSFWIDVKITWVNQGLDGRQTLGVKARSLSLLAEWLKWKSVEKMPH
ncbi:MAG: PilZ domain-containing protein [Terriglobia bacterium]